MIKAAVLGATGYAGIELVRLLTSHPEVSIEILGSHSFVGQKISDVYKNFNHVLEKECEELDLDKVGACDVAFTALPHGASKSVIPSLLEKGLKVIDLSGDYRYDDVAVYEKWYGEKHSSPELLKESVYGLPELHRDKIKNARLIGNPGCYTTCSILGTVPLLANKIAETKNIIVDAKSGVTGAGRGLKLQNSFCECTENMKAYKVATHRHTSEIEQELSNVAGEEIMISFTPLADIYTVTVNIAGLPAISTTCGYDSKGLPIGMSLIGKAFDEKTIIAVCDRFEKDFERKEIVL